MTKERPCFWIAAHHTPFPEVAPIGYNQIDRIYRAITFFVNPDHVPGIQDGF
jgi:hypothetical protein